MTQSVPHKNDSHNTQRSSGQSNKNEGHQGQHSHPQATPNQQNNAQGRKDSIHHETNKKGAGSSHNKH